MMKYYDYVSKYAVELFLVPFTECASVEEWEQMIKTRDWKRLCEYAQRALSCHCRQQVRIWYSSSHVDCNFDARLVSKSRKNQSKRLYKHSLVRKKTSIFSLSVILAHFWALKVLVKFGVSHCSKFRVECAIVLPLLCPLQLLLPSWSVHLERCSDLSTINDFTHLTHPSRCWRSTLTIVCFCPFDSSRDHVWSLCVPGLQPPSYWCGVQSCKLAMLLQYWSRDWFCSNICAVLRCRNLLDTVISILDSFLHPEVPRVNVLRSLSCSQSIRQRICRRTITLHFNLHRNSQILVHRPQG